VSPSVCIIAITALAGPPLDGVVRDVAFRGPSSMGDYPVTWSLVPLIAAPGSEAVLEVRVAVPDAYLVYRDRVDVLASSVIPLEWGDVELPAGRVRPPRTEGAPPRVVYDEDFVVRVPVTVPPEAPVGLAHLRVTLEHQGCHQGSCYPLVTRTREAVLEIVLADEH
jgi:hypothetical protein